MTSNRRAPSAAKLMFALIVVFGCGGGSAVPPVRDLPDEDPLEQAPPPPPAPGAGTCLEAIDSDGDGRSERALEHRFGDNGLLVNVRETTMDGTFERQTQFEYDEEGRLSTLSFEQEVENAEMGGSEHYSYETRGSSVFRHTHYGPNDPPAETTTFAYDELGRVVEVRPARGEGVRCAYDEQGRLATMDTLEGRRTLFSARFVYDEQGRLTRIEEAEPTDEGWAMIVDRSEEDRLVLRTDGETTRPETRSYRGECGEIIAGQCAPSAAPPPPGDLPRRWLPR